MQSFDVLSRELDVQGHRLLEASAGTGKTFAIEHLTTRLILEREPAISIDQILVVTFTRAATRELKLRIRTNLESALAELKEKRPSFDYLAAIVEGSEEGLSEAIRRIEDALSRFDQAQIFTIHSFCFRMLREFAFEAKVPFDLIDPEEGESAQAARTKVYDFFRTGFKPPKYSLSQIEAVLRKHKSDLDRVAKRLLSLIERKGSFAELATFEESHALFNAQLKVLPKLIPEKILSDFGKLAPNYKGIDLDQANAQLLQLLDFIKNERCDARAFDTLLREEDWFLDALQAENLKKRASLPARSELHFPDFFAQVRAALLPILHQAKDPLQILMRMARDCSENREERALSFDQLLHKMVETLENPAFCARVRARYLAFIVDEFQDTDPIQWKIFQTLFLSAPKSLPALYLVGDPKQSIYGFRGADVYTYLTAASQVKERAYLDTNFRSETALVQALNHLFSFGDSVKSWLPLPAQGTALAYAPVKHRGGEEKKGSIEDGKGAAHFFIAEEASGREKSWPTLKIENELFFPFIANEIHKLSAEHKFSFQNFAVLIKDRFQAERLQSFLTQRGISASITRGQSLIETRGYAAMASLVEALLDPTKIKCLLASSLFRLSHEEFKQVEFGEVFSALKELRETGEKKGFAVLLADFLALSWKEKTILERMAEVPDLYHEFRQTAELLMEEEAKGPNSLETLMLFLSGLKKKSSEEVPLVRSAPAQDAVSLMTVHMSKGLEFEIVFALASAFRHTNQEELVFIRENAQEKLAKLDPDAPASRLYLQEQDAEKMRQLYVALTRAKKRVYIPLAFDTKQERELEAGEAAPIELFFSLGMQACLAFLEAAEKQASITHSKLERRMETYPVKQETSLPLLQPPRSFKIPENVRYLYSFSTLAKKAEPEERPAQISSSAKTPHTLPCGSATGTVLHEILEKIFKKRLFLAAQTHAREQLVKAALKRTHLKGWEEVVNEMFTDAFNLPLPSPQGSFCLENLGADQVAQEMEFLFPAQNNLIKGFADLFFEWNGRYYLVDWKSNWLGNDDAAYSMENLEKAMHSHDYFLQGSIYASAFARYVKLFDKRPFKTLFGGAFYFFLRGKAAYHFVPGEFA